MPKIVIRRSHWHELTHEDHRAIREYARERGLTPPPPAWTAYLPHAAIAAGLLVSGFIAGCAAR
jgi:hypothetical protein